MMKIKNKLIKNVSFIFVCLLTIFFGGGLIYSQQEIVQASSGSQYSFSAGNGTEFDPYLVYTRIDLEHVGSDYFFNAGGSINTYYRLMQDINLNNISFTPNFFVEPLSMVIIIIL